MFCAREIVDQNPLFICIDVRVCVYFHLVYIDEHQRSMRLNSF